MSVIGQDALDLSSNMWCVVPDSVHMTRSMDATRDTAKPTGLSLVIDSVIIDKIDAWLESCGFSSAGPLCVTLLHTFHLYRQ